MKEEPAGEAGSFLFEDDRGEFTQNSAPGVSSGVTLPLIMRGIVRFLAVLLLIASSPTLWAGKPTYAKKGVGFPVYCFVGNPKEEQACIPLGVPSPNRRSRVEVRYERDEFELRAYLRITGPDGRSRTIGAPDLIGADLVWAPDSKAFFVTGNNMSAIRCDRVFVYRLDDPRIDNPDWEPIQVTSAALRDMIDSFPPCRAAGLNVEECKDIADNAEYNMDGIDWVQNSSTVVVMAEVPCSGRWGGIMCQVMGYEIEVPSGKILRRMTARELKKRWQPSMAFRLQIPEPPEYKK